MLCECYDYGGAKFWLSLTGMFSLCFSAVDAHKAVMSPHSPFTHLNRVLCTCFHPAELTTAREVTAQIQRKTLSLSEVLMALLMLSL